MGDDSVHARRLVRAIPLLANGQAQAIAGDLPRFETVRPESLMIDGDYQRDLGGRSLRLIRKIVANWDWSRFKPPVVAMGDEGLEIIDGQHTAIAAASHPGIAEIPVMIVGAASKADKAKSFVGHNVDRLNITPAQLHQSAVAAGDDMALTVQQVCERAGVNILRGTLSAEKYKVGDTISISAVRGLVDRRGAMGARKVLEVLVKAGATPVSQAMIRGVERVAFDRDIQAPFDDIAEVFERFAPDAIEREGQEFAYSNRMPAWRGFAAALQRKLRKRRGAA